MKRIKHLKKRSTFLSLTIQESDKTLLFFKVCVFKLENLCTTKFQATFKPFNKLFNQLKKTLSRKSLNEPEDTLSNRKHGSDLADEVFGEIANSNDQIKNVILRRMQSNKQIYEKLRTKSHVYSDYIDESQEQAKMKALFDYCLIVGLRENQKNFSASTDALNLSGTLNSKTNPMIEWKWPDQIANLNESITEFCFPDQSCVYDYKKNEREIFEFTLTNFDGSRTYGNCIKLVS